MKDKILFILLIASPLLGFSQLLNFNVQPKPTWPSNTNSLESMLNPENAIFDTVANGTRAFKNYRRVSQFWKSRRSKNQQGSLVLITFMRHQKTC
jgi:hypothetical protein